MPFAPRTWVSHRGTLSGRSARPIWTRPSRPHPHGSPACGRDGPDRNGYAVRPQYVPRASFATPGMKSAPIGRERRSSAPSVALQSCRALGHGPRLTRPAPQLSANRLCAVAPDARPAAPLRAACARRRSRQSGTQSVSEQVLETKVVRCPVLSSALPTIGVDETSAIDCSVYDDVGPAWACHLHGARDTLGRRHIHGSAGRRRAAGAASCTLQQAYCIMPSCYGQNDRGPPLS